MARYVTMMIRSDGAREAVEDGFDDLEEACRHAFRLADTLARRRSAEDRHPPRWVSIFQDDELQLSVQVDGSD